MERVPFVSVIVPAWNDTTAVVTLLGRLIPDADMELIVSLAGVTSAEVTSLTRQYPQVVWVSGEVGRGVQMNAGARCARGRWLVFLHADVTLTDGWRDELHRAETADAVGGCFAFALESNTRSARVVERGVAWRVRRFDLPYGDQALFVRRDVFEQLGGYAPVPLMEDVDFVRRLARVGRLWHSALPVRISARRWERDGWIRRTLENWCLLALYFAGVSPNRLARYYYRDSARASAETKEGAFGEPVGEPWRRHLCGEERPGRSEPYAPYLLRPVGTPRRGVRQTR